MNTVLVLNADYSPLAFVDMPRAVTLLLSEHFDKQLKQMIPQAVSFEDDPDRVIRSQHLSIPWPRIIALTRYVYVPFDSRVKRDMSSFATRKDILDRDRYTCGYCGKHGDTIDHIFPRSRGGKDTWENLVACCKKCNGLKSDRTPEEAGMKLLWQPYRPDIVGAEQRKIWATLSATG